MSDLRALGRRDGFAPRADLSDAQRPRRPRPADTGICPPLRRLSRLHGLRDRVSVRSAVRAADRGDARADRALLPAPARRPAVPPRALLALPVPRSSPRRARTARALVGTSST